VVGRLWGVADTAQTLERFQDPWCHRRDARSADCQDAMARSGKRKKRGSVGAASQDAEQWMAGEACHDQAAQALRQRGRKPRALLEQVVAVPTTEEKDDDRRRLAAGAANGKVDHAGDGVGVGVSFPGHFLVRLRLRGGMLVLDPFAGGAPQSEDDLRERLARVVPQAATGGIPIEALPLEQFLEPASHRQILARLLRNLKTIYRDADEPAQLLAVLNRILVVTPDASADLRDRGLVYQRLECWQPALADLAAYVEREPDAPDREEMHMHVMTLRAQCARMN